MDSVAARLVARLLGGRRSAQRMAAVFSDIDERRAWGDAESVSGPGSSLASTASVRDELTRLVYDLGARSLVDAGCGDCHWMNATPLDITRYVGVDVVARLVTRNQQEFRDPGRRFLCADITRDDLPQVDIVLCRDSLCI